ncbi:hypothetical protein R1flu_020915 [Riccia fluitans]|uniref:RING-type E3 ubiquitin transferase n=1 Tax=Riccia fluitans TaxID=41844 RepID=A0ABD1ZMV3_9MARC
MRTMNDEASSSRAAPPPFKRLRLLRTRRVCTSANKRTPLESVDVQRELSQLHHPKLEQQQQSRAGEAAGRFSKKNKPPAGDGSSPSACHSSQGACEASLVYFGETSGDDKYDHTDSGDTLQVHLQNHKLSEEVQLPSELPGLCTSGASSKETGQAVDVSEPVKTDVGEAEAEWLAVAHNGARNNELPEGQAIGGQEGQLLQYENAEVERIPLANPEVDICDVDRTVGKVDDNPGSRTLSADGNIMCCISSSRPGPEGVVCGDAAASSSREFSPVSGNISSLELVNQILREFELDRQIVRESQDLPDAPESPSHEPSTGAAVEAVYLSQFELPALREGGTSIIEEKADADEGSSRMQEICTYAPLIPAPNESAGEAIPPLAWSQLSPLCGAGASSEENQIADYVHVNSLEEVDGLAETNELESANLRQLTVENQVTVEPGPIHTGIPMEGGELPGFNEEVTEGRRATVQPTEDEDITAGDVVNILARTSRIVRAIETYSRSPDHPTVEDLGTDAGPTTFTRGLHSEVQLSSCPDRLVIDLAGEIVEPSRVVTTEDVANIYAQAGAIAQAANNWFSLYEPARNRTIENINSNANLRSLAQESVLREPGSSGENATKDHKGPDEAVHQSALETQEANVPDGLSCPICMEPWTNTGEHRICSLACGHLFGKSCIKRWIKQGGRRIGKCPHCNKRAKLDDLRNIYVPHIAVTDGHGYEMAKEVKCLKSQNEELKRMNSHLHLEMARLQLEMDRLRHLQKTATGAGILQRVEPSRPDESVNAKKRQAQSSLQAFFGSNDRRRSRRCSDEHQLDGRYARVHVRTGGHRSTSSLACIGSRGLGENFVLQDEVHLLGAKVFDMEDHSHMALVSNKPSNQGAAFGLTKISLFTLSQVQHISLPPGLGAIRDVRFPPSGLGAPGKLALVASLGKKLSLFSLESNTIVLDYPLQSAPWSCAWDSGVSNKVYAGLQNGSLLIFDLRQTSSPLASFPGCTTRPVHTLQSVESQARKGILSASNSGTYFWNMGSTASFTEIQRPLCISDEHREKLCVALAYAPCLKTAVASFRPSPLAQTETSSSVPAVTQTDSISQPSGTVCRSLEPSSLCTQQATTQDNSFHCAFSSRFVDSLELTDQGKNRLRDWRWEAGKDLMVGHKGVSGMPRSAIVVEPVDDVGLRASFACGDEGTNAVWLWDMNSLNVTQTLVPHQSPVLDVKYVNIGERILLGCISEKTFQLYRRPSLI